MIPKVFWTALNVLFILTIWTGHSFADDPIGRITRSTGRVTGWNTGDEKPVLLNPGSPVMAGQELQSYEAAGAQMVIRDDSVIQIFPGTTLQLNHFGLSADTGRRTANIKIIRGRARFILTRRMGNDSWFVVETDQATIRPDIADFFVRAFPDRTEIVNLGRSIGVKNSARLVVGQIHLGPCQKTVVKTGQPPAYPEAVLPEHRRAYQNDADFLFQ